MNIFFKYLEFSLPRRRLFDLMLALVQTPYFAPFYAVFSKLARKINCSTIPAYLVSAPMQVFLITKRDGEIQIQQQTLHFFKELIRREEWHFSEFSFLWAQSYLFDMRLKIESCIFPKKRPRPSQSVTYKSSFIYTISLLRKNLDWGSYLYWSASSIKICNKILWKIDKEKSGTEKLPKLLDKSKCSSRVNRTH